MQPDDSKPDGEQSAQIIASTRLWLEKAVIGLNLCPFAKPAYATGRIRFVLSSARSEQALLADLEGELETLAEAHPEGIETTLLIHPYVFQDFLDYNDFLDVADAALTALDLEGIIQVASFHPDYRFAGTEVKVKHVGNAVLLMPSDQPWGILPTALSLFEPGFTLERSQPDEQVRETLLP